MRLKCPLNSNENVHVVWTKERWKLSEEAMLKSGKKCWRHDKIPLSCSYCGGIRPTDALELVLGHGWEVTRDTRNESDLHLYPPEVLDYVKSGGQLPRHLWIPLPPVKVFLKHFNKKQCDQILGMTENE